MPEDPKALFWNRLPRDWIVKWSFGPQLGPGGFRYRIVRRAYGPADALARWKRIDAHLLAKATPERPVTLHFVVPYQAKDFGYATEARQVIEQSLPHEYGHPRFEAEDPKEIFRQLPRYRDWTVSYRDYEGNNRGMIILHQTSAEAAEEEFFKYLKSGEAVFSTVRVRPYRAPRRKRMESEDPKEFLLAASRYAWTVAAMSRCVYWFECKQHPEWRVSLRYLEDEGDIHDRVFEMGYFLARDPTSNLLDVLGKERFHMSLEDCVENRAVEKAKRMATHFFQKQHYLRP